MMKRPDQRLLLLQRRLHNLLPALTLSKIFPAPPLADLLVNRKQPLKLRLKKRARRQVVSVVGQQLPKSAPLRKKRLSSLRLRFPVVERRKQPPLKTLPKQLFLRLPPRRLLLNVKRRPRSKKLKIINLRKKRVVVRVARKV